MRKYTPVFLLLAFSLILFSCNNGSGEAYTLKMRLNQGDSFNQNMDFGMKMGFAIAGQNIEMDMDIKAGNSFKVLSASPGETDLEMEYRRMKMSMEMKGIEGMNNDLLKNNDAADRIVGKKITMKLSNKNEITEITGIEDVMWGDSSDVTTRETMKKMFSKEQMNSLYGFMFQLYPDKPVKIGESWDKETDFNIGGITMKVAGTYKLLSVKDSVASIEMKGKYKGDGKMNTGGVEFDLKMDGSQDGRFNVTLADGYIKNGQYKLDVDAKMKIMGQEVPMTMKGNYVLTNE